MVDRLAVRQAHQYVDRHVEGGRASEAVERALLNSDRFVDAAVAAKRVNYAEDLHGKTFEDVGERLDDEVYQQLREARKQAIDAVEALADEIATDALQVEMYGHTVNLQHCGELACPVCNEQEFVGSSENPQIKPEAFYLGTADTREQVERAVGWVCGRCGSTLEEQHDRHGNRVGLVVIERSPDAPEPDAGNS